MEYRDGFSPFSASFLMTPLCGDMDVHSYYAKVRYWGNCDCLDWLSFFKSRSTNNGGFVIVGTFNLSLINALTSWTNISIHKGRRQSKKTETILSFASNRTSYNNMSFQFMISWAFLSTILSHLNNFDTKYVNIRKPFCLSMKTHINKSA